MLVFIDTEFTDMIGPEILSIGMVSEDGQRFYAELKLDDEAGAARVQKSSPFVRYEGVLRLWHLIPDATCTELQMGQRAANWLLNLANQDNHPIHIAHDHSTDYELLEYLIRNADHWEQVREIVRPYKILPDSYEANQAEYLCYEELRPLGLRPHHALADALALKAAYFAVQIRDW